MEQEEDPKKTLERLLQQLDEDEKKRLNCLETLCERIKMAMEILREKEFVISFK